MAKRKRPNYLRWISVAYLLACVAVVFGIFLYGQALFRSMTWPVAPAEVVGEPKPVTIVSGVAQESRLQVDYEIRQDDRTHRGRGLIEELPADRRIQVRHAPGDPARNAIDLAAPNWTWKLVIGGAASALVLYFIRALFRGLYDGGRRR